VAKIKGLDKVIKELKTYGEKAEKEIEIITEGVAGEIVDDAKEIAKSKKVWDNGNLVRGINKEPTKDKDLSYTIFAREKYSAYQEFGTGGLVNVPTEMKGIASLFKGANIKKINIKPRPYMYPALLNGRKPFIDGLKQLLKELSK
jgi:HK97 gp10 family phage protein